MKEETEEFRIVFDKEMKGAELEFRIGMGDKIWRLTKRGTDKLLNLSTKGLAFASEKMRNELQSRLGGEWQISKVTLSISGNPSVTITIAKK